MEDKKIKDTDWPPVMDMPLPEVPTRGFWERWQDGFGCSVCHEFTDEPLDVCPNCGIDMIPYRRRTTRRTE